MAKMYLIENCHFWQLLGPTKRFHISPAGHAQRNTFGNRRSRVC